MRVGADEPVEPAAAGTSPTVALTAGLPAGAGLPPSTVFAPGLVIGIPGDSGASTPAGGGLGSVWWLAVFARDRNQGLARFLEGIHMLAHEHDHDHDLAAVDEFAPDRVGAPMGWSTSMAARWTQFADEVIDRLSMLHTALREGWLDETKARAFCDWTRAMPLDLARMVVAALLGVAPEITTGELIERIASHATALDPDWARRRELAARARARVVAIRTPAGTADVCARDLPLDQTVPMVARLDDLARAVRAGGLARGIRIGIGPVRALCSLRLQDGTYTGHDDDTLIDALIDELPAWHATTTGEPAPTNPDPDPDPDDGDGDGDDPDPGPDNGPNDGGPNDGGPNDTSGPDDGTAGGANDGPDDRPDDRPDDGPDDGPDGPCEVGPVDRTPTVWGQ